MISVDSLLYKIDQKLNKLSTNEHQSIQLEDKILALNEAQIKLIKRKVSGIATTSGLGLEGSRKRYEDLQNLIVDHSSPLDLKLTDENIHQYTADLTQLTPKYLFYIDSYVVADKGKCKNKKIWVNKDLTKHADVSMLLNNSHYKPSFEYEETFSTLADNKIAVYTDGTFTPKKIYVSYLRYPKYINKEGYVDLDGNETSNQDCELASYLEDELVDLAVQDLAEYTENSSAVQSAQFRIQTSE